VSRGFTPRRITAWDERIAELVGEPMGAADDGFDMVSGLAAPLPVQVITELLGADRSQASRFRTWADATTRTMSGSARDGQVDPAGVFTSSPLDGQLRRVPRGRA
jgi:cytochrome P450